ncbi:twin-arginine translocation signal domain-containing protein [Natrialbaceae archaeon A-CW1-1]
MTICTHLAYRWWEDIMPHDTNQNVNTSSDTGLIDGISRRTMLKASGAGASALGIIGTASADYDDNDQGDEDEFNPDDFNPFETSELNLETLEAEIPGGTLQAEPLENTYVGEVTDDLFVGVSFTDDDTGQPEEIAAYLCDGNDIAIWLVGEYEVGGVTLADEEDEVKLAMVDGEFLGAASLADEEGVPFLAAEATGDAGLYQAETEVDEVEVTARWIVLSDGRQRGTSICCAGGCCPPIVVCWPCREQF